MAIFSFICKHCGPSEHPCEHALELIELKLLRELEKQNAKAFLAIEKTLHTMREESHRCCKLLEAMLLEILHILNRPQSATLTLQVPGGTMPATILVGGTASSLFQEWSGPNGSGTVVPNAGVPAFASDNPAVATVDPSTGVATGVAAGVANISGTDPANGLSASDVLTVNDVTPPPAQSATLTLTPN